MRELLYAVETFLNEIITYEILKNNPHPNICKYYGCIREGINHLHSLNIMFDDNKVK